MGSFFTNVQVRRGPYVSLEVIERALDELAAKAGMVRGGLEAEAYDRTIIVRAGPGPWISVYDENTEDQYTTELDALAMALSGATHSTAVSVLVHDSDVLLLGLFVGGQKVDEFNSRPRYFEGVFEGDDAGEFVISDEQVRQAAGQPERWRHVLVPGATPEMLSRVWQEKKIAAEQMLAGVAELLGCSLDRVQIGLNYFEFDVPSTELLVLPYVFAEREDDD